jgi:hypothetical protein
MRSRRSSHQGHGVFHKMLPLQAERSWVRDTKRQLNVISLPNHSGHLGLAVYLASNTTVNQRQTYFSWKVQNGQCVGQATLPPFLSWLSRQCGILNISQPYRPPRPVTGITLLFYMYMMFVPHWKHTPSRLVKE